MKPKTRIKEENKEENKDIMFFIHSACCMAHWELIILNGEYHLICEKCHRESNLTFSTAPPTVSNLVCAKCKEGCEEGGCSG